jgi:hypothetical protein
MYAPFINDTGELTIEGTYIVNGLTRNN